MDRVILVRGPRPSVDYRCPRCNSNNIVLEEFDLHYRFYKCGACDFSISE